MNPYVLGGAMLPHAPAQQRMLVDFDAKPFVATGVHPLLLFLVRMHLERERGLR